MSDQTTEQGEPAHAAAKSSETRRQFVERLAKIAAVPLVQPLMLTISRSALAAY